MTPGARIAAAIEILSDVETGGRPTDAVAADFFRQRRFIGSKDRAQIAAHVYTVLRHRPAFDWWIERASAGAVRAAARGRMLAALTICDGWGPDDIAISFDGSKFRPAELGREETRLVGKLAGRSLHHPEMPRATANDIPEWLEPYLQKVFGKDLEAEMAALNRPAPMDLRINLLKTDREGALKALAAEHIKAEPTAWAPLGLRVARRAPLAGTQGFKDGLVEVQDEGSQLAALLADARPGMRVVDFCAGAGGKTLALAATMRNKGKLVACDVAGWRLERAAQRLRRAGVSNVERRELSSERDLWVKHHSRSFDRVFVDAPCLGVGTWRRNPDAKWRSTPQDLAELVERQQAILRSAARLVKPGGRLIYVTCSLLREENEDQAESLLAAMPYFALYPAAQAWAETIGGECPGGADYLRLTPARHGTDGFFVAVFERRPTALVSSTSPQPSPPPAAETETETPPPPFPEEREGIHRDHDAEGEVGRAADSGTDQ